MIGYCLCRKVPRGTAFDRPNYKPFFLLIALSFGLLFFATGTAADEVIFIDPAGDCIPRYNERAYYADLGEGTGVFGLEYSCDEWGDLNRQEIHVFDARNNPVGLRFSDDSTGSMIPFEKIDW